jgi:hypothetical protein
VNRATIVWVVTRAQIPLLALAEDVVDLTPLRWSTAAIGLCKALGQVRADVHFKARHRISAFATCRRVSTAAADLSSI